MSSQETKIRKRILFVAENVTLAQVVRLATLARCLDEQYDVHFATSEFDDLVFQGTAFSRHCLYTIPKAELFRAMEKGDRLYDTRTLLRYVEADLELLDKVQPDLVVADFRLSMSVSAEKFGVPWATLVNAYWSPFARRVEFPVPDHPIIRLLGETMTARYFPKAIPAVFKRFAKPVNDVRRRYGLSAVGSLLEVLTFADYTLYPDDPRLTPVDGAPSSHVFLGPVQWSPPVPMPDLPPGSGEGSPLIYATLGSSGRLDLVPALLEALGTTPARVILAGAGRLSQTEVPDNVALYDYVPGDLAAQQAAVVLCNGGSTTGYQALAAGKPLLLLPSNFDQYLASQAIEREGAGLIVKARQADVKKLRSALLTLLEDPAYKKAAERIQGWFAETDSASNFRNWVERALTETGAQNATRNAAAAISAG